MIHDPRLPGDPFSIVVFSDLSCSFAHVAVHRLRAARTRLGLDDLVVIEHRAFPLELLRGCVSERADVDIAPEPCADGPPPQLGPGWPRPATRRPTTTLPALEAVQAAARQGRAAAERMDVALRRAFWAEGRCISLRHVLLEIAATAGLDVARLAEDLDGGRCRADVLAQFRVARDHQVACSPHIFLADGSSWANPGVRVEWVRGGSGVGHPVVSVDEPGVYDDILDRAAGLAAAAAVRTSD